MAAQQPEENKLEFLEDEEEDVHHEVCSDSGDAVNPDNDDDNDNDNEEDNNKKNSSNSNSSKAARLPRWTRQEILVLIQGKKVAENRVRRGRTPSTSSSSSLEPKWSTVSSYCTSHGVLRGPIQCRKRWSNLAGDFKKIKDWESRLQDDSDSFWFMRNDLRRQRKLPGFFDRHVFDILDHKKELPLFDSGRTTPADDPLFSDLDASRPQHLPSPTPIPAPTPISGWSLVVISEFCSVSPLHAC